MKRRRLLSGGSVVLGAFLCGCQRNDPSSGTTVESERETPAGTPSTNTTGRPPDTSAPETTNRTPTTAEPATTATETEVADTTSAGTTAAGTSIVGRELTVGNRSCASGSETETGTLRVEASAVLASGTVTGSDGCATARLATATYDPAADRLRIVIETVSQPASGAVCAQCLTAVEYDVRIAFEGAPPDTVVRIERGATGEQRTTTETG